MMQKDEDIDIRNDAKDLVALLSAAARGVVPDRSPADWDAIRSRARLHQVDHYLYPVVASWDASLQPSREMMSRWRLSFFGAISKYSRASIQASEMLGALHQDGIKVVPLKGIWLAERVYEDGACRPMCDFDILVAPDKLDRARATIEKLGYTTPDHFLNLERDKHVHYLHEDYPMVIELHWKLWHEAMQAVGAFDSGFLWQDLQEEQLHGCPVYAFSVDRQLVYLCQHILHHELTMPSRAYLDLILLYQYDPSAFDLGRLEREACAWGVPFGAKFVLTVIFDLFDVRPRGAVADFLADAGAFDAERRKMVEAIIHISLVSGNMTPAMEAVGHGSSIQRLRLVISRIFIPREMILPAYPEAVKRFGLIGGYAARIKDLIRRQGRTWRSVKQNDPQCNEDLENYRSRRELSSWIQQQDGEER